VAVEVPKLKVVTPELAGAAALAAALADEAADAADAADAWACGFDAAGD